MFVNISVQEKNINRHLNNDTHKILSNDLTNLKSLTQMKV